MLVDTRKDVSDQRAGRSGQGSQEAVDDLLLLDHTETRLGRLEHEVKTLRVRDVLGRDQWVRSERQEVNADDSTVLLAGLMRDGHFDRPVILLVDRLRAENLSLV